MRSPIISDTTRSVYVVRNPFGDEPQGAGWYVAVDCPVSGREVLPFPARATREEAEADVKNFLGLSA